MMTFKKHIILIIVLIAIISSKGFSQESEIVLVNTSQKVVEYQENKFPKPIGIINDYEHLFTKEQIQELSNKLFQYDRDTTRQIVVITIDDIAPYEDILDYATAIANEWGVGDKEKNNGLAIVFSSTQRKIGIATGLGTELVLTDQICKEVIDTIIIPEFKNGLFYDGVQKGIEALIKKWD